MYLLFLKSKLGYIWYVLEEDDSYDIQNFAKSSQDIEKYSLNKLITCKIACN